MNFIIRWIVTGHLRRRRRVARAGHRDLEQQRILGGHRVLRTHSVAHQHVHQPILQILSLPVTVLTLGIFYLVVNTLLLYIAAWLANGLFGAGFYIASFGSAFVASIVISLVSALVNGLIGNDA